MAQIVVETPLGPLTVTARGDHVVLIAWGESAATRATPVLIAAARQLRAYFGGDRFAFDLPLAPVETPFQRRVRAAMQAIPFGETLTYGDLAATLQTAPRAVGGACRRNPLPVVVPCHRVVGGGGRLTGYTGGRGLTTKRALLLLERTAAERAAHRH